MVLGGFGLPLLSIVGPGSDSAPRSASLDPWLPLPTPEGWTVEEIHRAMVSFSIDGSDPDSLFHYVNEAIGRFLHTWGLVRDERGKALELGANPYFISWLLQQFSALDLTLANYFGGEKGELSQRLRFEERDGSMRERRLVGSLFNMEEDRFPYDDESFDVVLFCEIIEHLLMDPLHALREIRRVTRPSGLLVLTTPNAARLGNVLDLIEGRNLYDLYSGYGPYGRHNREYTSAEILRLIEFAGYRVESWFTANSHRERYDHRRSFAPVAPLLAERERELGQYIFVVARATDPPREGLPSWLYRSWPADRLVDDPPKP
jgi:SAM-dependent methyltransferase